MLCTVYVCTKVRSGFFHGSRAVRMMRCVRGGLWVGGGGGGGGGHAGCKKSENFFDQVANRVVSVFLQPAWGGGGC